MLMNNPAVNLTSSPVECGGALLALPWKSSREQSPWCSRKVCEG